MTRRPSRRYGAMADPIQLSIIVPIYNEEESLPVLLEEIR